MIRSAILTGGTPVGKRILILSASAGTGHLRAAAALEKVFKRMPEVGEVCSIDVLKFTNQIFRDFYSKLYMQLVVKAPSFLGWWYKTSDEPWKTDRMRLMLDRLNMAPFVREITLFNPDITVCTHFLPAALISHLISEKKLQGTPFHRRDRSRFSRHVAFAHLPPLFRGA